VVEDLPKPLLINPSKTLSFSIFDACTSKKVVIEPKASSDET
jgi:hypothetical protein